MKNETQRRAKVGGEVGANGDWYDGGKFINTVADNAKAHKETKRPTGRQQVASGVWETAEGQQRALYTCLAGVENFDRGTGKFSFNAALGSYFAEPEAIVNRKAKIEAFNRGEKWFTTSN